MTKRPPVNNQIKAQQVRLIDEVGKQLGVVEIQEALRTARERNLDLVQVTEKVEPPVCKIVDFGKYLYREQRKEKTTVKFHSDLKGIRLGFRTSQHDMEIKAKLAEKFLKKGHKVRVELVLRGREKTLSDIAKEKAQQFLESLNNAIPIKTERELKREARGFTAIITKA
ncbi:MAG: translation initiation factor IF-3 [Candidatus Wildermuthbacteria bacterium RIFCSPLOWO2_12_FULL_40_9]|uniref:Translation initiation factor IF-3 n=2 Tax=Candidatus Wildermuthiibacteriota TaxID=1817923 RepID=A0A1G2REZ7_9BACT|nr:MAG: translation initiation factor IF-3 [Candidatus Wildermuthbacteria bacterium RIFCSPHIGHO2_12_FULL_40_12]OHA76931.1 MAG: translation initiation factor IF-3 [Candidatus Wildermuthbacteria bacterium RIFCSPLOWO2_12_FULL_40_9]